MNNLLRSVYARPLLLLAITLAPSTLPLASDVAQAASLRRSRSTTIIDSLPLGTLSAAPRAIPTDLNSDVAQAASLRRSRSTTIIHSLPFAALAAAPLTLPTDLDSLINGLQAKYSRMQGIAADFTQIYQGPDGRVLKESGHVLLKRPRKARWDYSVPERKIFLSDGKEIYFYVYGEKEATRAAIKESADPQIPFLFLLGQGNLRRDFARIEIAPDVEPAAQGDIVLKLVPKRAPEDFKALLAEANPVSFEVRRLVIFGRNGSRMDFLLTNIRENYVAPDSDFTFTPPTGVIVRKAQPQT